MLDDLKPSNPILQRSPNELASIPLASSAISQLNWTGSFCGLPAE